MHFHKTMNFIISFALVMLLACGGSSSNVQPEPQNLSPSANAGADQIVDEATSVQLSGSASDPDGTISLFEWSQTSGVTVEIENVNAASASFIGPEIETDEVLVFRLLVTDNDGAMASDSISINIMNVNPPVETFSISGNLSGATGELEISLNGTSNLTLAANGNFTFDEQLAAGSGYLVTLVTSPVGQNCELQNDSGVVADDISDILILCGDIVGADVPINDEFSMSIDLQTTSSDTWIVDLFDGTSRAISIDANLSKSGWLIMIPEVPVAGVNLGWFEDFYGSYLYQNVSGNFSVVTKLRVVSVNDINEQPTSTNFNAGGFVIRDPSGAHNGNENWIMYNMGGQFSDTPGNVYAREIKKTVNSISNMFLTDQSSVEEHLLACRIDNIFYFYYWDNIIDNWREETFYNSADLNGDTVSTRVPNGTSITPEIGDNLPSMGSTLPINFTYDASNNAFMPESLQVGVIAHNWSNEGDTRAEFDYVRFATIPPISQNDCLTEFLELGNE